MRSVPSWRGLGLVLVLLAASVTAARAEDAEPESLYDLLLEKYDANKDGVIAAGEYSRGASAFQALDRNGDDVLTKADFPRPPRPPNSPRPPVPPRPPEGAAPPSEEGRPIAAGPRGPAGADRPGEDGGRPRGPREGVCPCCGRPFGPPPPPPRQGEEFGGAGGPPPQGPPPPGGPGGGRPPRGAPPPPPEGAPVPPMPPEPSEGPAPR